MAARTLIVAAATTAALAGCAQPPRVEYRPIPAMLIPPPPTVPTIAAAELACLSDEAYLRLAERDRARRQYADALRALLEVRP